MDDLISRKTAIKAIEDLHDCYNGFSGTYDKACIIGVLEELPSAQPEPKRGRWIRTVLGSTSGYGTTVMYQCTECERMSISIYDFCPNCGAKMEVNE